MYVLSLLLLIGFAYPLTISAEEQEIGEYPAAELSQNQEDFPPQEVVDEGTFSENLEEGSNKMFDFGEDPFSSMNDIEGTTEDMFSFGQEGDFGLEENISQEDLLKFFKEDPLLRELAEKDPELQKVLENPEEFAQLMESSIDSNAVLADDTKDTPLEEAVSQSESGEQEEQVVAAPAESEEENTDLEDTKKEKKKPQAEEEQAALFSKEKNKTLLSSFNFPSNYKRKEKPKTSCKVHRGRQYVVPSKFLHESIKEEVKTQLTELTSTKKNNKKRR